MDPFQIKKMLKPIKENNYDFVSGSRFLKKGGTPHTSRTRFWAPKKAGVDILPHVKDILCKRRGGGQAGLRPASGRRQAGCP